MSSRGRSPGYEHQFYVYMFRAGGNVIYIGKGSGKRFKAQVKNFSFVPNCIGGIVRYFASEKAAYNAEARLIAKHSPKYNANKGGGGAITRLKKPRLSTEFRKDLEEIKAVGTKVYVARRLLNFDLSAVVEPSKLERIRQVAYGSGC